MGRNGRGILSGVIAAAFALATLAQAGTISTATAAGGPVSSNAPGGGHVHVAPPTGLYRPRVGGQIRANTPFTVLPHTTSAWTELGPRLINTNGTDPETYATGRVASLAATPPDASGNYTLYAGTAGGGVWKSTDAGLDWTPLSDTSFQSLIIGAVAVDPNDGSTVFAGTGEAFDTSAYGYGIYKTSDGGTSWTREDGPDSNGNSLFDGRTISAIAIDPTSTGCPDANHSCYVYAGVVDGVTRKDVGVAVSADGGTTWTEPTGTGTLDGDAVTDLLADTNGNLYAAVTSPASAAGVWYSAEASHGAVWTQVSKGLPTDGTYYRIALMPSTASSTQTSQTLYAAVAAATGDPLEGVYRTTTGGVGATAWTQIGTPPAAGDTFYNPNSSCPTTNAPAGEIPDFYPGQGATCTLAGQANYDLDIVATDTSVYVGQIDIFKAVNAATSSRPEWYNISNGYGGACTSVPLPNYTTPRTCGAVTHVDQHAALAVPTSTPDVYFGNDGGLYQTPDGGQTFVNSNGAAGASASDPQGTGIGSNPLRVVQFYAAAVNGTDILAGSQDNGSMLTTDSGSNWNEVCCGDGMFDAIDPTNTQNMYTEGPNADVTASTDGFSNTNNNQDVRPTKDNPNFSAPLVMDPTTPSTLYSGQAHLWRTIDSAVNWTNIGPTAGTAGISAIGMAPSATATIYIGDNKGGVWVTQNATDTTTTPTWVALTGLPGPVSGLAVDPIDPNTVYASVNTYESTAQHHVYKGVFSGGAITWTDISTALPNFPFFSVAVDLNNHNIVYAGSYNGVYESENAGSTWLQLGTNLPDAQVSFLIPTKTTLYAVTYGRGAWSVPLPATPTVVRVGRFGVHRSHGAAVFHWRVASTSQVTGFNLYAGGRRLNRALIRSHAKPGYTYRVRWTGRGPFSLHIVMRNGEQQIVR